MQNYIYEYYQGIKNGSIIVGKWIRLLYERIVKSLESKETYYNANEANRAIEWIEAHCYHTEGYLAPSALRLELWQKALIACVFGIYSPKDNKRAFREIVLIVARKNGKSLLMSSVCKYLMYNGDYGSRIYCLAPQLAQADIVYNNIWQMITLDPDWQKLKEEIQASKDTRGVKTMDDGDLARHRQSDLYIPSINSQVKKIAFSGGKRSDGFSPSAVICDEIASWEGEKGLRQYEVMKSAMGAREMSDKPPLLFSCSTAGYISEGIYDELLKRSTHVLQGSSKETKLLPFLYIIDDIAKWNDITELQKSNPNLGISLSVDYLLEEIAIAEGSLSKKREFICKYANKKQNSSAALLPAEVVEKACGDHFDLEDFRGSYAVIGVDLSQVRDLSAVSVVIERGGELYVVTHFWLPADKIDEASARDGVPYQIYIERGLLSPSGEGFIDYHDIYDYITALIEQYEIYPLKCGYDRWSATYLVDELKNFGLHMDDVWQGDNLYPIIQTTCGLLESGHIHIGDNDLLKMHLLDSALKMSPERGRGKLVKVNKGCHIDGFASLLDAMTMRDKWNAEIGEQLKNER